MKFIKQKSTDKIVYRESPHTDKTITNAVIDTNIDLADLEVVDTDWTNEQWTKEIFNQQSYSEKRADKYPDWKIQLDKIYHDGIDAWKNDMIKPVKDKYSKE